MVDTELLIGWVSSFLILVVLFKVLNKKAEKGWSRFFILKTIAIGLSFHSNLILSLLLYEPVMNTFEISTDGFMNLNGLTTFAIIWLLMAVATLVITNAAKEQLGVYYKTIRITQFVFISLPLLVVFIFMIAGSLK